MNKPNKSLIAMRKAGLVKATAITKPQKIIAKRYLHVTLIYCKSRAEESLKGLKASYELGKRGIRIGQEDLFCKN
tara:strand:- start:1437 stop:1661 length:225 start_codon:yes stop_codon:yes gene_type:complete